MVLGYLLLGWIGGLAAAALHLAAGGGTWLGAAGLFVAVGNLSVIGLAGLAYLRCLLAQGRQNRAALAGPVSAFPPPARADRSGEGR